MARNAEVIRQWSILRDLEASKRVTIDDLAERTGVTTRTIRRDLEAESLSPSLALDRSRGAAFEMKFLLDRALADQVRTWAGAHLLPDPHGDAARGNASDVTTTYLDTKDLDIARRALGAGARKFRMRRYGPTWPCGSNTSCGARIASGSSAVSFQPVNSRSLPNSEP